MTDTSRTVLQALGSIADRLRTRQRVEALALALAVAVPSVLVAATLSAILARTSIAHWPWAGAAILLLLTALWLLGRWRQRVGPEEAARVADERAGLEDELKSALWFSRQPAPNAYVTAMMQNAAGRAARLVPRDLVPLAMPGAGWVALGSATLLAIVVPLSPRMSPHGVHDDAGAVPVAETAPARGGAAMPAQAALEEAMQAADEASRARLEKLMAAVRDPGRSAEEKRRAIESAREIAGQSALEAAASREQMRALADSLAGRKGFEEVSKALREGDARAAADALRERLPRQEGGDQGGNAAGTSQPQESAATGQVMDALKDSLQNASSGLGTPGETEGRLSKAVQNLEELSRRLDASAALSRAGRKLAAVSTALKRETTLRAAQFGRQQGQGNPGDSPDTGDADLQGGAMYRLGALAKERRDGGQESNRAGDNTGNAPGDPVVGDETSRIKAKYKRETVRGQEADGNDGTDTEFYAASRRAEATVELQAVESRYRHVGETALSPERIALRHRTQVRQFFLENAESAR
jgi:hypothetical protein